VEFFLKGKGGGSADEEGDEAIALMNTRYVILAIWIFILFACGPTKVTIYPRETPPAKTRPESTPSDSVSKEKTLPEKPSSQKETPGKVASTKPSLDETPTEKTFRVTPSLQKNYDETVSEWKSYQDVAKWMESNFSVDIERFGRRSPLPKTPKETFNLQSGIDIDAAMFLKETLNRVDPSYQAQIVVVIIRPNIFNRYICSFRKDGKLFIMDYGTPYKEVTGLHGPYDSIEEYKKFYEKHNPEKRTIEGIIYLQ
jgi:hypothetical protein